MTAKSDGSPFGDPITFAVIKNAFDTIVDEMAYNVMRTARSHIVRDVLDYSTTLCDRQGRIIAQGRDVVCILIAQARHQMVKEQRTRQRWSAFDGQILGDLGEIVPVAQRQRECKFVSPAPGDLPPRPLQILGRQGHQRLKTLQHYFGVARILGRDRDPVILFVPGYDRAAAVEDHPPRRWQKPDLERVLFGQKLELVGLIDLKVTHAEGQRQHRRRLYPTQHQPPSADPAMAFQIILRRPSHARPRAVSGWPEGSRLRPNSQILASTTSG